MTAQNIDGVPPSALTTLALRALAREGFERCCQNLLSSMRESQLKMSLLLSPRPLIRSESSLCAGSKETAEQDPVRQHGTQEEEAAKASKLGFDASTSGAGFEPASLSARVWNPVNPVNPVKMFTL